MEGLHLRTVKGAFIFIFVLLNQLFWAQTQSVSDSLISLLKSSPNDSNKVKILCGLAENYRNSDFEKAQYYANESLKLSLVLQNKPAEAQSLIRLASILKNTGNYQEATNKLYLAIQIADSLGNQNLIAQAHTTLGLQLSSLGNYQKAIEHYEYAIKAAQKSNNTEQLAVSIGNYGSALTYLGEYDKAVKYHLNSARLFENIKNKEKTATCHMNVGNVYMRIKNYKAAISFYEKSLVVFKSLNNREDEALCLQNIGNVYYEQGQINEAMSMFQASKSLKESIGNTAGVVSVLINIAVLYSGTDRHHEAIYYLEQADSINKIIKNKEHELSILNNLGYAYLNLGKPQIALKYFTNYLTLAEVSRSKNDIRIACYNLSVIYSKSNQHKEALEWYKRYTAINDSILNDDSKTKISETVFGYQLDKKEQEIRLQKYRAELGEINVQHYRIQNILLIIAIGFLVISGVFIYLYQTQKRKQKEETERLKTQQELLKTEIETRENEQKRIAAELHDSLGQILSTLKLRMSALKEGSNVNEHLDQSLQLIQQASSEARNISYALMPPVLLEFGLEKALIQLAESISKSGKVNVVLNPTGLQKNSSAAEIHIYRIVQELLNNSLKHADANIISIHVRQKNNFFWLEMEDNGTLFNPLDAISSASLGWQTIRARILLLNGDYKISRSPSGGFSVNITLYV